MSLGRTAFLLGITILLTLLGDWCIKHASGRDEWPLSLTFGLGAVLYGLPAFCWFYLMRGHALATIGVLYSAATIVCLAAIGTLAFGEALGARQVLGLGLAVASVVVMGAR